MSAAATFRAGAAFAVRRPWLVLGLALGGVVIALAGATRIELHTSNLDLVAPDIPEVHDFLSFAREFGTPNVLVVALEGDDDASLRAAVDRLGPLLAAGPGVDRVLDRLPYDDETLEAIGAERYFATYDGRMYFVIVQPDDPYSSAATIEPFVRGVRERLAAAGLDSLGVRAGLTGMPAYALDDRDIIQREASVLSLVSLVVVVLLFRVAFGAFRRPLLVSVALLVAVGWTLGLIAVVPGHLTLLSAFFAPILFGVGDYGIHVVARLEELLGGGLDEPTAIVEAVAGVGPGATTGAATSAVAFAALNVSGFRGFAELGTIAAMGITACLVTSLTVLPALLSVFRTRGAGIAPIARTRIVRVLASLQRGWIALPLGLVSLAGLLGGPGFDSDYLHLQPERSEAVRIEREMVRRSDLSPAFAAFVVPTRASAAALTERLLAEPTVGDVRSIVDLDEAAATAAVPPEVPRELRAAFESPTGRFAVYAYPSGDIWDAPFQEAFVGAMKAIDPHVTGMPILGRFMIDRSRVGMQRAAVLGALFVTLCLLVDFRRPWPALAAGLPTALTVSGTLGAMRVLGMPFNPLSVMALPIILGVAMEYGVHIVHRFVAEDGDAERTVAGTGRSVALTAATTLAGFAALGLASHWGLASFAITLAIGVGLAALLSLVVLPTLLRLSRRRILRHSRPERELRAVRRAAAGAIVVALLPLGGFEAAPGAEQRGDAAWAERAGGFAVTHTIDASAALRAVDAYSEALAVAPDDLPLSFKLVQALYFAGHFAAPDARTRQTLSERQLELAERCLSRIEGAAGGSAVLRSLSPADRARRITGIAHTREAYFWSAITWGVWAMSHSPLAAVRHDAAGAIRDRAETLIALDPAFASAAGLRLLGRLHTATPRVPLVTGWIDRRLGLALLRKANVISTADGRNPLFLAEAILEHEPEHRAEARALLRAVVSRTPDPDSLVEQTEIIEQARAALARAEERD